MTPANFAVSGATLLGGAVLGLGALINRGCVFGSIAKLGSGNWAYLFTPAGFYLGCLLAGPVSGHPAKIAASSPLFGAMAAFAIPLAIYAAWRGRSLLLALRRRAFARHIWAPHQATMVIGLAFVVMLLTVGNWAYTQLLADLASGKVTGLAVKLTLFAGLLGGAILGGWTAGLIKPALPAIGDIVRCLVGGMLMGAGSLLIPGSNDGLILLGLPLILPYAWVALASMILAIILGMLVERRITSR
jgi:Sulphur transport